MTTSTETVRTGASSCCAKLSGGSLAADDAVALASKFKAMGDPTRLQLLSMIAAQERGESCVCDLNEPLNLSQATVSHHLKVLLDAGFLTRTKRGTWSFYALVPEALEALSEALTAPATR